MRNQHGDIKLVILIVLTVIVMGAMIYLLVNKNSNETQSVGVSSPTQIIETENEQSGFDDGLGRADSAQTYDTDEFDGGISRIDVFYRDINSDDIPDRITRTLNENGTAHFYYEYKIELRTSAGYIDITPNDFTTSEGADCALRKFRFVFQPKFQIIQIARPWEDTWDTPTVAYKTIYELRNNKIIETQSREMGEICDVSKLF